MSQSFKQLFDETREAIRDNPDLATVIYETKSRLEKGFNSQVRTRQFAFGVDEPEAFGGEDKGPTPTEYLLAALGSCQEITYRLYADALGIPLNSVSVKLEADLDLRGFLAADDEVRPGFQGIRGTITIDSPASEADIARLKAAVDRHCPVLDIVRNPTPVTLTLNPAGEAAVG